MDVFPNRVEPSFDPDNTDDCADGESRVAERWVNGESRDARDRKQRGGVQRLPRAVVQLGVATTKIDADGRGSDRDGLRAFFVGVAELAHVDTEHFGIVCSLKRPTQHFWVKTWRHDAAGCSDVGARHVAGGQPHFDLVDSGLAEHGQRTVRHFKRRDGRGKVNGRHDGFSFGFLTQTAPFSNRERGEADETNRSAALVLAASAGPAISVGACRATRTPRGFGCLSVQHAGFGDALGDGVGALLQGLVQRQRARDCECGVALCVRQLYFSRVRLIFLAIKRELVRDNAAANALTAIIPNYFIGARYTRPRFLFSRPMHLFHRRPIYAAALFPLSDELARFRHFCQQN
jgi:hypothetical protein